MDLVTRVLPREEWPRLYGTECEDLLRAVDPKDLRMVVVEQDGQIIARWAVWQVVHFEGLWVHPDHRKRPSVARRIFVAANREARRLMGRSELAMTAATTDDVRRLIEKHMGGMKVPVDTYMVRVQREE